MRNFLLGYTLASQIGHTPTQNNTHDLDRRNAMRYNEDTHFTPAARGNTMSITKNRQSDQTLRSLTANAFPGRGVCRITELTEGMFNAAYRIDFADGGASILKIAAATQEGLLSNEINLMQAEVAAMQLAYQHELPVARLQYSDFTRTRCSGPYFFMEALPGRSLHSCQAELDEEALRRVLFQVGELQRRTASIHHPTFGLMGDSRRFDRLYDLIRFLFCNVLRDAAARSVALPIDPDALLTLLERDQPVFDEVSEASFVHWDMWEGNIFVHREQLSGVIDWERAMWGDPFMDDRFRRASRHEAFLAGFGQTAFTPSETRRILWYDVFLYTTMITECTYRQYEGGEAAWAWLRPLLTASWTELNA